MTPLPSERRFDELFIRYWDNRMTDAEAAEFAAVLAADPFARDWFRANSLQAVAAADLPVIGPPAPKSEPRGWSRRRAMQYLGGGIAASLAAGLFVRQFPTHVAPVRITAAKGGVTVTNAEGRPLQPDGILPPDSTVITHGTTSSAVLVFPNGSDVLLAGDSAVSLTNDPHQLLVLRGSAIADVHPAKIGERALSFRTTEALVSAVGGVLLTLTRSAQATEVGVHTGQVAVTEPTGEPMDSVRDGELYTIRADGRRTKQTLHGTADQYKLDLTKPLPDGWHVGKRDDNPNPPVLRPEEWFDPYHQAELFQIRSHHRWGRGLFRLYPDSRITAKYRVHTAGRGQICLVSRTEMKRDAATGVLEWNGRYETGGADGWRTVTVRADQMLNCKEAPKFGPPWVTFLFIFNTYGANLGLEVADFRVSRPGGPVEG